MPEKANPTKQEGKPAQEPPAQSFDECVVAVFDSVAAAQTAVHILNRSDFPTSQVSLITSHLEEHPELEQPLKFGDDSVAKTFRAAGLGGVVGVLAGFSAAAIAGGGVALFAGPVAGLATGTVVGAFLGQIEGWGIHKTHIEHYEKTVRQGHVLVLAQGNPLQIAEAHRVLKQTGARELHVHAKTSDDSPEIAQS